MKQYTKTIPLLSLVFILFLATCMLAGCNNAKTYSVVFMTAINITYTESQGVNCIYSSTNNDTIFVEEGNVIGSAPVNTQYGTGKLYQFAGWFTEKECINQWDLFRDEVKSNLTLYPKYVRIQ